MSEMIEVRKAAAALNIETKGKSVDELKAAIKKAKGGSKTEAAVDTLKALDLAQKLVAVLSAGAKTAPADEEEEEETEEEEEKPVKGAKKPAAKAAAKKDEDEEEEEEEEEEESSDEDEELEIDEKSLKKAKEPQLREWAEKINKLKEAKVLNPKEKDVEKLRAAIQEVMEAGDEEEEEEEEEKPAPKAGKKPAKEEEEEEEEFTFDKGDRVLCLEGEEEEFTGEIVRVLNLKKKEAAVKSEADGEVYDVPFSDIKAAPAKKAKKAKLWLPWSLSPSTTRRSTGWPGLTPRTATSWPCASLCKRAISWGKRLT